MKLKVYPREKDSSEKLAYFKLEQFGLGLKLTECDGGGNRIMQGDILYIDESGIKLCSGYCGSLPVGDNFVLINHYK